MSLIVMCVYDTLENNRTKYTKKTLQSLARTVNWNKHRLIIVDNDSCKETKDVLNEYSEMGTIISLQKNIGTAKGINLGIRERRQDEPVIKIDNDVVIYQKDWVEEMELVLTKLPKAGIIGLKRKDLGQSPDSPISFYKTELLFLPHTPGERWVALEKSNDIMGTCTMFSPKLLDTVGYMRQPGIYGFDDSIFSHVSLFAEFDNYFLPAIEIDHIDEGGTPYIEEKRRLADSAWNDFQTIIQAYKTGRVPLYYDGGFLSTKLESSNSL